MRKFMITFVTVLALGAVAPLTAGAAVSGTIEFLQTGGSVSPPTDANDNGILDAGDYLDIDQTLEVTASTVALVPVGTSGSLVGILTVVSSSEVSADIQLSVPNGSLRVSGLFSTSVLESSGEPFDLSAFGWTGIFLGSAGTIRVSPGETTTFLLTLQSAMGVIAVPPPCDAQLTVCGSRPESPDEPLLAPSSPRDDGPAVGRPRMPDLHGVLTARWDGSALHVRLRVRISKPRLVKPFDVEFRGQGFTRTVHVRPRGRTSVLVQLTIPLSHVPSGKVTARIDAGDVVLETRERNNTLRARVG